ncbi:glutathione S-transferase-like [Bradysia coprophila]|uniref:glutathione S-transferase-like n=1 Tax=Bradysia coprophila TaxID=38358 RepID=UPI00187DACCA|nr:glutathione S-transferase-like [Bradysia coprophila]XP_037032087.1 glutathione S-transferase-like [Bradysia coprophila]
MAFPSENPKFKLSYFNVKALAEPIRLLFAYGGVDYEDIRVSQEEWAVLKPTMPMGQMPVLEVDGQRVHQSVSMARYVAKRVNLSGANDWENLLIDTAVDTVNDFRAKIATVQYEPDEAVKEKKRVTLNAETIPFYLTKLDAIAKENNGHLALGKLTWADFYLTGIIDYLNYMVKFDLLAAYPNLKAVVENVNALDAVKAWVAKRPVTDL